MAGIIGRKVGMTRIFDAAGNAIPVTVIEAGPCPVTHIRTAESDGYTAVQLGFGAQKATRASKAETGHVAKAGLSVAPRVLREFPLEPGQTLEVGQSVTVDQFAPGDRVKVTGTNKGRGFQGVIKRHRFNGKPRSHGHPEWRNPGSIGPGTDPSRVIKGKRLPGRMGGVRQTIINLQVVQVDAERNLIFVKGGVPGARDGFLMITK
ncbi:MAG: 50S ribosomal protein L3 [Gemmatimonadetes bacterium]|nr:50S ribosomal protein L3 [Gemmatimonadota bacterium]